MGMMDSGDRAGELHERNRKAWNQSAAWYRRVLETERPRLAAGATTLHPVELSLLAALGPLRRWCRRAVHLQCSSGMDTVSLWNLGVREVIGVDIADEHIANARALSDDLGVTARWIRADVLAVPADLDGSADLVFTGKGAVHWMHDLPAWARVVHRLLRPGGVLILFDLHSGMNMFRQDGTDLEASGRSYFAPLVSYQDWPDAYVGELDTREVRTRTLRSWPPSAVVQALLDAGLVLERFGEHPDSHAYWKAFPRLDDEQRRKVPATYSLVARRPAAVRG